MTKKQKLLSDRAHLDALPILLQPLIECSHPENDKTINFIEALNILIKWDEAREWKEQSKLSDQTHLEDICNWRPSEPH